jgi:hypothetical protein
VIPVDYHQSHQSRRQRVRLHVLDYATG